jgi:hypothetical protein
MINRRNEEQKKGFRDALEMVIGWLKTNPNGTTEHLKFLLEKTLIISDLVEDRLDEIKEVKN